MGNTRWLDRSQPQTLYYGNVLLYFNAAWWLLDTLFGAAFFAVLALWALFAGLGVANEKRLGYWGGVVLAVLNLLMLLYLLFVGGVGSLGLLLNLVFGAALLALLLHPMSRSYERIWFKKLNKP
jgi:hypothetical protein